MMYQKGYNQLRFERPCMYRVSYAKRVCTMNIATGISRTSVYRVQLSRKRILTQ